MTLHNGELSQNELSRREFLSAAATLAALLALGGAHEAEAANAPAGGGRVGISDAAYASARSRAQALVAQMTLKEKISQTGNGAGEVSRLNLPGYNYYSYEALHGVVSGPPVTSFPVPLALAAAWNPELARQVYAVVADECRAHNNISQYSPATLNLHRDPRWGRCYEAPGEDPCLAATLAVQIVRGMQGDNPAYLKTTACSKHFICNNTDSDRESVSATVDPRSFWEYYTRSYRATVVHGDVFTFMSAYNAVNGVPCSADRALLTDLLRGQWGFRGYVNSDCDAVKDIYDPHHYAPSFPAAAALAIKAGCEINCGEILQKYSQAAVDHGLLTEQQIGEAVTRVLTVRVLLGTLDPPEKVPYTAITLANIPWSAHEALALESARQSLVLLKNEADFLPLDPAKAQKIAVIGPLSDVCLLGGYSGSPKTQISPLRGLKTRFGLPTSVDFISGGDSTATHGGITTQNSPLGTTQLAYISNGDWAQFHAVDFTGRTEMHAKVASAGAGGQIEVHLDKLTGPLAGTFTVPGTGGWDHLVDVSLPLAGLSGLHDVFVVFKGGTGYILNLERLTLLPLPPPVVQKGARQITFHGGCSVKGGKDAAGFAEAVESARGADVVVMVCGVDASVSGEGYDRETIGLTGTQPELIKAVYAVNPKVVLVLSSNNSVSIEWEQAHLPAILCAICAGQAQGTAIAEALFGDFNPGGKLPCTWYRSLDQLPPSHDYDIHKGRTYMYLDSDPLYPFGYGLSYTTFRIDGLHSNAREIGPGQSVKVSVHVTNTGKRVGAEVVQLYVVPPASPVKRPYRQLAAFQRVELKPGEGKTVVFEVPYTAQAFWYWGEAEKRFVLQPGAATLEIGNSSAHLPLKTALILKPSLAQLPHADAVDTVSATSYIV
jgi:beta-glucosidase